MQKLIFTILILFTYSLNAQTYKYVNINKQEGMSNNAYFSMIGEKKYLSIIKSFENDFNKVNNGYPDYYRLYTLNGNVHEVKMLVVSLIPKKMVSEQNKKRNEFRIYGDKSTLEVFYDIKTKKISKVRPSYILPDL